MVVSLALVDVNSGDTAHAGMLTMHKQWNHFLIDHCNLDYKCILTLSKHFDPQCDNRYLPKSCYTHTTPWPCILYPLAMHTSPPGYAYSTPWPCILYPLAMHTLPPGHAYFTPWPCILYPLAMHTLPPGHAFSTPWPCTLHPLTLSASESRLAGLLACPSPSSRVGR